MQTWNVTQIPIGVFNVDYSVYHNDNYLTKKDVYVIFCLTAAAAPILKKKMSISMNVCSNLFSEAYVLNQSPHSSFYYC